MKRTIISGLVTGLMIISACADGGKGESESATTNPTSATATTGASDSNSSTTGGTAASGTDTTGGTGTATATTGTTTATATSSPTDPTGDTDTTGCTFLCMPDGGNDGTIECDIWAQDCSDPNEKCMPWANDGGGAWNSTKCSPLDPNPANVGDACTVTDSGVSGVDNCEASSMCWNVDAETNEGTCVGFCEGSEEACTADPGSCCGVGQTCSITNGGVLILCLQACDPIIQDCMGQGEVCYPVANSFQCAPDVSGDMGVIGDPCEYINVCDPGTFCGNPAAYPGCDPMAGGCCIPFCELDAPDCAAMTECQPWYDPMDVPPGFENLGACVIPS